MWQPLQGCFQPSGSPSPPVPSNFLPSAAKEEKPSRNRECGTSVNPPLSWPEYKNLLNTMQIVEHTKWTVEIRHKSIRFCVWQNCFPEDFESPHFSGIRNAAWPVKVNKLGRCRWFTWPKVIISFMFLRKKTVLEVILSFTICYRPL